MLRRKTFKKRQNNMSIRLRNTVLGIVLIVLLGFLAWFFWPKSKCGHYLEDAWRMYRGNNQWLMINTSSKGDSCIYSTISSVLSPKHDLTPTSIECKNFSNRALAKELELWFEQGVTGEYCSFSGSEKNLDCTQCCTEGCENICPLICDEKKASKDTLRVYSQHGFTKNICPGYAESEADLIFQKFYYRSILSIDSTSVSALESPKHNELSCCNPDPSNRFACLPPKAEQNNCIALQNKEEIIYCGTLQNDLHTAASIPETITADHIFASVHYFKWLQGSKNSKPLNEEGICTSQNSFLHTFAEIDSVIDSTNYDLFIKSMPSEVSRRVYQKYLDGMFVEKKQNICVQIKSQAELGKPNNLKEKLKLALDTPILSKYNTYATNKKPLINPLYQDFSSKFYSDKFFDNLSNKTTVIESTKQRLKSFTNGLILEPAIDNENLDVKIPLWKQIVSTKGYKVVMKDSDSYSLHKSFGTITEYNLISFEREHNLSSAYTSCHENKEDCVFSDIIHNVSELGSSHSNLSQSSELSLLLLRPGDSITEEKRQCLQFIFSSLQKDTNSFDQIVSHIETSMQSIKTSSSNPHIKAGSILPKSFLDVSSDVYLSGSCSEKLMISASYPSSFLNLLLQKIIPIVQETSGTQLEVTTQNGDIVLDLKPAYFLSRYPTLKHAYSNTDDVCQITYQDCFEKMIESFEATCNMHNCDAPHTLTKEAMYKKILPNIISERLYFPLFWLKLNTSTIRQTTTISHLP